MSRPRTSQSTSANAASGRPDRRHAVAQAGDDELNRPFIEELAFGRRAQQLIDQAAAR